MVAAVCTVVVSAAACTVGVRPMAQLASPAELRPCRVATLSDGAALAITWNAPQRAWDRERLDALCDAVQPPVVLDGRAVQAQQTHESIDELAVVSWNLHVGAADVERLVAQLRGGALTGGRPVSRFVLLLQEAYRAGHAVPVAVRADDRGADAIRTPSSIRKRANVVALARSLGLFLYYAPSMRIGAPSGTSEDRGNAILSTEPLSDLAAVELPFERQRRVAVAATVDLPDRAGARWPVRLVSAHLENRASVRRLWVLAQAPRTRQAHALLASLPPAAPVIVGGDFNTWFGFSDPTYKALAAAVPDAAASDRRATFRPFFRLDHLFSRLPPGWTATARRLDDRFGSDHYPILARVRVG